MYIEGLGPGTYIIIGLTFLILLIVGLICVFVGSVFMFGNIFKEDVFKKIPYSEYSTYVVAFGGVMLVAASFVYIFFGYPPVSIYY